MRNTGKKKGRKEKRKERRKKELKLRESALCPTKDRFKVERKFTIAKSDSSSERNQDRLNDRLESRSGELIALSLYWIHKIKLLRRTKDSKRKGR